MSAPLVADYTPVSAVALLLRRAERTPDEPAFTHASFDAVGDPERSLTYLQLLQRASAVAARLAELDARAQPVVLLYPAGLDFPTAFFGAMLAGAVAVPVPLPQFEAQYARLEGVAADCHPRAVLSTEATLRRLDAKLPVDSGLRACPWVATDQMEEVGSGRIDLHRPALDELAFLQYTSGSTGAPRGVAISHANVAHNVEMIRLGFGWPEEHARLVSWLPHFHDMGLVVATVMPLRIGETISAAPLSFLQRPLRWLQLITRHKGSISGAPPFAYELCTRAAASADPALLSELDLSSWRIAFVGADSIRPAVLARFAETFAPYGLDETALFPCYGMAETTLMTSVKAPGTRPVVHSLSRTALSSGRAESTSEADAVNLVSCGTPAPGTVVRVVDPELRVAVPDRQVGELWVAGPHVSRGYWSPTDANPFGGRLAEDDGATFLRTGDLGFMVDGEVVFVDRLKDLIVFNGQNYLSHDLEQVVGSSSPELATDRCAVTSVESEAGTRLLVLAELPLASVVLVDHISARVRAALFAAHGLGVATIAFVPPNKLSRTTSGKLRRRASRDRFLAGELRTLVVVGQPPE